MKRTIAACLAMLALAAPLVSGCDAPAHPAAAGPLTDIADGPGALSHWRYQAAQVASELLAVQSTGLALAPPTGPPDLLSELTASLVLGATPADRALAGDVAASLDQDSGLFVQAGAEPLLTTWLVLRWSKAAPGARPLPSSTSSVAAGLGTRMRALAPRVAAGDSAAAATYLLGQRSLALLGTDGPPPPPPATLCGHRDAALTTGALGDAATWLEVTTRAGDACAETSTSRITDMATAVLASESDRVNLQTVSDNQAAAAILSTLHGAAPGSVLCSRLAAEQRPDALLVRRPPVLYLICADAAAAGGTALALSPGVVLSLRLQVDLHGRLNRQQATNVTGLMYAEQSLAILRFRPDVLRGVAAVEPLSAGPDGPFDTAMMRIVRGDVRFTAADLAAEASALRSSPSLAHAVVVAATVRAAGACPIGIADALRGAYGTPTATTDLIQLSGQALVATTVATCPGSADRDWAATRVAELSRLVAPLGHPDGTFGAAGEIRQTWRGQETLCLLTGVPTITAQALRGILPDVDPASDRFSFSLDTLYSAVRLTDIAASGCRGAWWDPASATAIAGRQAGP